MNMIDSKAENGIRSRDKCARMPHINNDRYLHCHQNWHLFIIIIHRSLALSLLTFTVYLAFLRVINSELSHIVCMPRTECTNRKIRFAAAQNQVTFLYYFIFDSFWVCVCVLARLLLWNMSICIWHLPSSTRIHGNLRCKSISIPI